MKITNVHSQMNRNQYLFKFFCEDGTTYSYTTTNKPSFFLDPEELIGLNAYAEPLTNSTRLHICDRDYNELILRDVDFTFTKELP